MTPEKQSILAAEILGWRKSPFGWVKPQSVELDRLPAFHTDANASLQLVEWMRQRGWNCTQENGLDGTWEVTFHKPDYEGSPKEHRGVIYGQERVIHYQPAPTVPLAVLGAFLGAFLRAEGKEIG